MPPRVDRAGPLMPEPALFESARFVVGPLPRAGLPALQAIFEADPRYFVQVGGQPPRPDEAEREFEERPPAHLGCSDHWFCGVHDRAGRLRGVVILDTDLAAPGVWHIALFFLHPAERGTGAAAEVHDALEAHARAGGAAWLRLCVIEGNATAERFWARCGYTPLRTRPLVDASGQERLSRVMVKALTGAPLERYLERVPRDAPGSPLA